MTPEKFIQPKPFTRFISTISPPVDTIYVDWLEHRNGQIVLYLHGPWPSVKWVKDSYPNVDDAKARDVFGEACHCCVFRFAYGTLEGDEYQCRFATTERSFKHNPWGKLCQNCQPIVATKLYENFVVACGPTGMSVDEVIEYGKKRNNQGVT